MDPFKEWPEWQGADGNPYKPGDRVAVATVQYKSPVMKIGTVVRINRVDSKGAEIGSYSLDDGDPHLKAHWESLIANSQDRWSDPVCLQAYQNWRATMQKIFHPSATVVVEVNGTKTTYRTPENLIKIS